MHFLVRNQTPPRLALYFSLLKYWFPQCHTALVQHNFMLPRVYYYYNPLKFKKEMDPWDVFLVRNQPPSSSYIFFIKHWIKRYWWIILIIALMKKTSQPRPSLLTRQCLAKSAWALQPPSHTCQEPGPAPPHCAQQWQKAKRPTLRATLCAIASTEIPLSLKTPATDFKLKRWQDRRYKTQDRRYKTSAAVAVQPNHFVLGQNRLS